MEHITLFYLAMCQSSVNCHSAPHKPYAVPPATYYQSCRSGIRSSTRSVHSWLSCCRANVLPKASPNERVKPQVDFTMINASFRDTNGLLSSYVLPKIIQSWHTHLGRVPSDQWGTTQHAQRVPQDYLLIAFSSRLPDGIQLS